ncbi:TPA: hypothetical protein JG951_003170 [Enterobacter hormaechei subsp. steigerwaltii]|nr:hypothetical protein [Enterobacter hormaechei subsp. steigerwaltii]
MDGALKRADLSYLPEEVSQAARELVDLKFRIDMAARNDTSDIPPDLHGRMRGGEWGPHFGLEFFCCIIPFLPRDFESCSATEQLVPTSHTFGCSWRWWPDRYCDEKDEQKIRYHIFSEPGLKSTSYTFIPQLGLFCPGEGKNRVNFCRHHNIECIPARVYPHDYPEAKRISLYLLDVAGGVDAWAVLDNRYVQKVSHHAFALPLLRAYGVTIAHKWPAALPSISDILANEWGCADDSIFHKTVFDMHVVQEVLNRNDADKNSGECFVKTSILELPLSGVNRTCCLAIALSIAAVITYSFCPPGFGRNLILCIAAFLSGGLAAVTLPIFRIKRKSLVE